MEIMSVGPTIDCSVDTKDEIVEPGFTMHDVAAADVSKVVSEWVTVTTFSIACFFCQTFHRAFTGLSRGFPFPLSVFDKYFIFNYQQIPNPYEDLISSPAFSCHLYNKIEYRNTSASGNKLCCTCTSVIYP